MGPGVIHRQPIIPALQLSSQCHYTRANVSCCTTSQPAGSQIPQAEVYTSTNTRAHHSLPQLSCTVLWETSPNNPAVVVGNDSGFSRNALVHTLSSRFIGGEPNGFLSCTRTDHMALDRRHLDDGVAIIKAGVLYECSSSRRKQYIQLLHRTLSFTTHALHQPASNMKFILPVLVTLFAFALAAPSEEGQLDSKCYDSGCKAPLSPIFSVSTKVVCASQVLTWGIHTLTSDA
jgi:hypothetical protein